MTGFFSTDFTASEIQLLTAVQPLPFRNQTAPEPPPAVLTVRDILSYFAQVGPSGTGPGLYMELKHPEFHARKVRSLVVVGPSTW